jgi:predicted RNA binding protein YcfA (HicA-like mRNA interferase family)
MNKRRILEKALAGSRNISFDEFVALLEAFGFRLSRINGSHHVFVHQQVRKIVNLQEENGKAKYYQVRQFLRLVEQNHLELGE